MRTLLVALMLSLPAFAQDAAPAAAPEAAKADAASYAATIDALWMKRDESGVLEKINNASGEGLQAFPNDYGLLWRAARTRWWNADGVTDSNLRKQLAKEGWNYAKKAVDANNAGVEGHYFVTVNIGAYSQAVGILAALGEGLEGKFLDNLNAACKADETFNVYGCFGTRGRYHYELPWPKRDLKKSKEWLDKAITAFPNGLRYHYYLAETLLKDGDAKAAKEEVGKALNGSNSYDPPEARRIKGWARELEKQIDKAL